MHITRHARRAATLAGAVAAAATLTVTLAGAASAATAGHRDRLAPEHFTIAIHDNSEQGAAYGPVHGRFTDVTLGQSGTRDLFVFRYPRGTAEVDHTAVNGPRLNRYTCQGFAVETGRWRLDGVSGADRNAYGSGRFVIFEHVKAPRDRHGQCDQNRAEFDAFVSASGLAANPHR
jgi:hypothetical protein